MRAMRVEDMREVSNEKLLDAMIVQQPKWYQFISLIFCLAELNAMSNDDLIYLVQAGRGLYTMDEVAERFSKNV